MNVVAELLGTIVSVLAIGAPAFVVCTLAACIVVGAISQKYETGSESAFLITAGALAAYAYYLFVAATIVEAIVLAAIFLFTLMHQKAEQGAPAQRP